MTHQNDNIYDKGFPKRNPNNKTQFVDSVNLLVQKEIKQISMKTSDPTRAEKVIEEYLGSQIYQQRLIGRMWFMGRLLKLHVFPQEVQVIAKKIIYGHK